ncbi:3-phytase [Hyphomonas neptunium ATCC 15444]|uniref:3-phytase n=2 Tax=Hyphomonas TaxID=85 RepID=Q0C5T3_HYPNA|nr:MULTISPECIES: phytase [Hyphomonas]ABI78101.1 3-phytase [Hyphomonas neptunium ATCC 15444]KCZ89339.1 3-phytase [Hyphomonas hirschiana VP5]
MSFFRPTLATLLTLSAAACATAPAPIIDGQQFVMASVETTPAGAQGDAADDPAVWLHPADPEKSLILGTNKQVGLVVYALDGSEVQNLPIGLVNNIDVRQSADRSYDVAIASNDQVNAISVFMIDRQTAAVSHTGDIPTGMIEPYGICQGRENGRDLAGVTYKDGTLQIWEMSAAPEGVAGDLLKTVKLETQLEGCVFDEANGLMFVGEENRGLWTVAYREDAPTPALIDTIDGPNGLVADVEGVSIWKGANGAGWVVASAQEDDRFVVYERQAPHAPRGSFSIIANETVGIDEVSHTDGIDVFSGALPGFPRGVLVVQDDGNPRSGQDQNFKIVNWADVEAALGLTELNAE